MKKKQNLFKQVLVALFCAIVLVQTSIPFLGYIPLGVLNLTIIQITVIVSALTLGLWPGVTVGFFWGVVTFIRAFVAPTSPLAAIVFVNPIISVVPRMMIAVMAFYSWKFFSKFLKTKGLSFSLAAILGALTNTILVLGAIYLFYRGQSHALYAVSTDKLLPLLLGIVATNGIPEALLSAVITPVIVIPVKKLVDRKSKKNK